MAQGRRVLSYRGPAVSVYALQPLHAGVHRWGMGQQDQVVRPEDSKLVLGVNTAAANVTDVSSVAGHNDPYGS